MATKKQPPGSCAPGTLHHSRLSSSFKGSLIYSACWFVHLDQLELAAGGIWVMLLFLKLHFNQIKWEVQILPSQTCAAPTEPAHCKPCVRKQGDYGVELY